MESLFNERFQECFTDVVVHLNLRNQDCILFLISKVLGMLIVLGGMVVKVPQIMKILKSSSAEGISRSSVILEAVAYFISIAYHIARAHPFSTYGETVLIGIQDVIIVCLIFAFQNYNMVVTLLPVAVATISLYGMLYLLKAELLHALFGFATLITISSRLPQIWSNFVNASTGQLSLATSVMMTGGSTARIFTTMQEVGDDKAMLNGFIIGATLNATILFQILWYWKRPEKTTVMPPKLAKLPPTPTTPKKKDSVFFYNPDRPDSPEFEKPPSPKKKKTPSPKKTPKQPAAAASSSKKKKE